MNGKEQAVENIISFLNSDEKALLLTGTHQYNKHKLVMAVLDKYYRNASILFRVNGMNNIPNENFIGFAGLTKPPKSGQEIKIGHNYYTFDSLNRSTWNKTGYEYNFAILYPVDPVIRSNIPDVIDDLLIRKNIGKIFLVSWTDRNEYKYSNFSTYYNRHIVYDAEEDDLEYHKRVLNILDELK